MAARYVGLGEPGEKRFLYEADRKTRVRQVLWGDYLNVESEEADGWLKVVWSPRVPSRRRELFIPKAHSEEGRPLEIVFVDVGQGDGSVLVTPETGGDEHIIVIDAGEGDNMERYLKGRFKAYRGFQFDAAVITHPDQDHYLGFSALFNDAGIGFDIVYHNGLVERAVSGKFEKLGGLHRDGELRFVTDLPEDDAAMRALFPPDANVRSYKFPKLMKAAASNPKVGAFSMLSTEHGMKEGGKTYMPGFAPSNDRGYCIEVLGPVVERDAAGRARLREIGDYGETKNGHSVLLRLTYGQFSIFFGGDLNEPAENFILAYYGGVAEFPEKGSEAYRRMVANASERFRSDVMKVCHHGSEKVTDAFLEAVNPACFIISSGDEEGHVHPRPDLLGRLGRFGRGEAPVLLSTELQRSAREREQEELVEAVNKGIEALASGPSDAVKAKLKEDVARLARTNVEVYGAITVKTDGKRLIAAFRVEEASETERWFYFEYEFSQAGELIPRGRTAPRRRRGAHADRED
jgi:beta-lactamase superfamily II metal-dependent hydrolase